MKTITEKNIFIILQGNKVFLVNQLDEPIKELIYSTYSVATYDEIIGVSDAPFYKIRNIPVDHAILLEILDGWEDGSIHYELVGLQAVSYKLDQTQQLKIKRLSGLIKLPPQADCKIEKLSTDKGFVVDIDNKDEVHQLYWQVEELKSYTDLAGNRFDIDNAQRRLWQMYPILQKGHLSQELKLYNELNELLEVAMFFDKTVFTQKVDELFRLVEVKYK